MFLTALKYELKSSVSGRIKVIVDRQFNQVNGFKFSIFDVDTNFVNFHVFTCHQSFVCSVFSLYYSVFLKSCNHGGGCSSLQYKYNPRKSFYKLITERD